MSKQEFSRLDVLLRVQSGRLRVSDACVLIGLQRRQVFRLLRGLKQDGATSLLSKRRGRPSNHRLPAAVRTLALSIPPGLRQNFDASGLKPEQSRNAVPRNYREVMAILSWRTLYKTRTAPGFAHGAASTTERVWSTLSNG